MTTSTDLYILARDHVASVRLNLQHFLWRDQLGFLLHPDIKLDHTKEVRIADIGAGTGVWATDLARILPSTVQIDGLDIDISQTPPEEWLPSNVRMRQFDLWEPLPEDMVGQYDVVAIRLFVLVIPDGDPGHTIEQLWKMLKPGGYLQWSDMEPQTATFAKTSPDVPSDLVEKLVGKWARVAKSDKPPWVPRLHEILKEHGFTNVQRQTSETPHDRLMMEQMGYFITFSELARKKLRGKELEDHAEQTRQAMAQARNVAWSVERFTVIGMKEK